MTTITQNYKPLEIQSDYSVSNERKRIYTESLQNTLEEIGGIGAMWYLPPESFIQAHSYLTSNLDSNTLSFKNTLEQEQTLATKATSQMQDFLTLPNLSEINKNLNAKDSKNTFGGYSIDSNGFMGEDFNKAAGLPSDYKIHKNVLQALNDFYTVSVVSNYESIDLIAGISNANKEFNRLFTEDKSSYTKEEIMQKTKGGKGEFYENYFDTALMQDYKNKDGTFQREGIMVMYGLKSGALEYVESPHTIKRERKEDFTIPNNAKEKTPEEKAKELKDALDDYYLKAIEVSKRESVPNKEYSIPNSIAKELHKDKISQLEINKAIEKFKNHSAGGEWIKVQR